MRPRLDRREALLLGVEHPRRPAVRQPLVAGQLDDAAVRREVAAEDGQAAGRLQRLVDRDHHRLLRRLHRLVGDLAQRPAVDVRRPDVHEVAPGQLAGHQRNAARVEHVDGDEAAARLEVGDDRRPPGDRVEVVDRERDVQLARDRQQVQHAVGRAAARGDRRRGVLERLARDDLRGPHVVAHQPHDHLAALLGGVALAPVDRRDPVHPGRADAQEVERHRHRVGGVLAAARARPGAGGGLDLVELLGVDLVRRRRRRPPRRRPGS